MNKKECRKSMKLSKIPIMMKKLTTIKKDREFMCLKKLL
jgi:hypothetical protein